MIWWCDAAGSFEFFDDVRLPKNFTDPCRIRLRGANDTIEPDQHREATGNLRRALKTAENKRVERRDRDAREAAVRVGYAAAELDRQSVRQPAYQRLADEQPVRGVGAGGGVDQEMLPVPDVGRRRADDGGRHDGPAGVGDSQLRSELHQRRLVLHPATDIEMVPIAQV